MIRLSVLRTSLLGLIALCMAQAAGAVSSVSLTIQNPGATTPTNPPILVVQLLLDLEPTPGVGNPELTVVDPNGDSLVLVDGDDTFFDTDSDTTQDSDEDGVELDGAAVSFGGPTLIPNRYTLQFLLQSNVDTTTFVNTMTVNETFTITSNADYDIRGVCALSFYFDGASTPLVTAAVTTPPARVGGFDGACQDYRPGLDVVMALDRSGSMSGPAGTPKVQILRDAVGDFVQVWNDLRAAEVATIPGTRADRIGVNLFSGNADWWGALPACGVPGDPTTCLHDFATAFPDFTPANLATIPASGSTSIGDGVKLAFDAQEPASAAAGDARKVILLLSDGMQNTNACIGAAGGLVFTHPCNDPTNQTLLGSESNYQIYAVTLGPAGVVDSTINMALATATGGFYASTETDYTLLRPFFLELLQNFLQFNSHQTVIFASAEAAPGMNSRFEIPVSATSTALSLSVMWDAFHGSVELAIQAPDGTRTVVNGTDGALRWTSSLPIQQAGDHIGIWTVEVRSNSTEGPLAFKLHGIAHDVGIRATFAVDSDDLTTGGSLRLRADLREFGDPLTGVGTRPGELAVVRVSEPGVALGELLSASSASSSPPAGADGGAMTPAEAKLINERESNPSGLAYGVTEVRLFDDGSPAHGDDVANDGVYSALHPTDLVGHYNALFAIEGRGERAGAFRREQLITAYVRAEADPEETEVASTIVPNPDGLRSLVVTITPRTNQGHLVGPLYQNYLWVQSGGNAVPAIDQLDGTYRATLLTTNAAPDFTVHWIPPTVHIRGNPTVDQLPVPLDENNQIGIPAGGAAPTWSLSLHLGVADPQDTFASRADAGLSWAVDFEIPIGPDFALEAYLGGGTFDSTIGGSDPEISLVAFDLRWYPWNSTVRPFALAGFGYYDLNLGDDDIAFLYGAGVQIPIRPRFALELEARRHSPTFGADSFDWLAIHGGVRIAF